MNQPTVHFNRNRFSQLSLHVVTTHSFTERLKPCAVRRTVISTFGLDGVGDFIAFIFISQPIVDQHLPTEFMIVDVTVCVGNSPLKEIGILYGFERELRFAFLIREKIHRTGYRGESTKKTVRNSVVQQRLKFFLSDDNSIRTGFTFKDVHRRKNVNSINRR